MVEMEVWVTVLDFLEGTQQTRHIMLFPRTGLSEAALVEIDEVDLPLSIQKDVVGVEIGMKDIGFVKAPDAATDGQPDGFGLRGLFQPVGQSAGVGKTLGDQVRPIDAKTRYYTGCYWPRNRKSLGIERRQQTPFPPGAGSFGVPPQIVVVKKLGDQTAATIVPQHPILPLITKKIGFAPAESFADQKAARGKLFRIENVVGRLCNPRGIV